MSKQTSVSLGDNGEFTLGLSLEELKDISENKTRRITFDIPDSVYENLSDGNKKALQHLTKAAVILDSIALLQDHPDNIRAKDLLEKNAKNSETVALTHDLFKTIYGVEGIDMYSQKSKPLKLFKDKSLTEGKGFYPQGLSETELANYILKHPEQASAILSNNTIVKREGKRLKALPYSIAFSEQMEGAAREILEASAHTDHKDFSKYLAWQAQALVNDSDPEMVFNAEKAVINLEDSPLEFNISRECYEDDLSGAVANNPKVKEMLKKYGIKAKSKDTIGIRVGIVNKESNEIINTYRNHMKEFSELMPLNKQYDQSTDSTLTLADVDLVAFTGRYNAFRSGIVMAQNLPNDDKLSAQLGVGSRVVFHRQARKVAGRLGKEEQDRLLDSLVCPSQKEWFNAGGDFKFLTGHELAHSLGPTATKDGNNITVSLGIWGDIIEENKADLGAVLMTDHLVKKGEISQQDANEVYLTWVTGDLPTKQPSKSEAHRYRSIMQVNYLREKGAIHFEKGGKLRINPEVIPTVAKKMLTEAIQIQLDGDAEKAGIFAQKYGEWNEALQYSCDKQMELKPRLYRAIEQPMMKRLLAL